MWHIVLCLICGTPGIVFSQELFFVGDAMVWFQIIPDIIPFQPMERLTVTFPSGAMVDLGNEIPLKYSQGQPEVKWDGNPSFYYTLAMIDAGESRSTKPFRQWLVTNIPGCDLAFGDNVSPFMNTYRGPGSSDVHRNVFLVYLQPRQFLDSELDKFKRYLGNRLGFSLTDFLIEFNMFIPSFGDFYISNFTVPFKSLKHKHKLYKRKNTMELNSQEPSYKEPASGEVTSDESFYLNPYSQEKQFIKPEYATEPITPQKDNKLGK